jgi:hypothetical protein
MCICVYPEHSLGGWQATGEIGHFGATAAYANLLDGANPALGLEPSDEGGDEISVD